MWVEKGVSVEEFCGVFMLGFWLGWLVMWFIKEGFGGEVGFVFDRV